MEGKDFWADVRIMLEDRRRKLEDGSGKMEVVRPKVEIPKSYY